MKGRPPESDEALLAAFGAGDRAAFDELVVRHRERVFQFARWFARAGAADGEDIAQGVWLQVFRSAASFRGRSSFRTWLYGIARNVCLGWLRDRGAAREIAWPEEGAEALLEVSDGAAPPLEKLEREERERLVRRCVERLAPEHRLALMLRVWEGMRYAEIAEALAIPLGTVRSRLHNATARLSAELARAWKEGDHGL